MAHTAIIAQARMGSTRLPGKVLKKIAGETVMAHVIRRAKAVENADTVCIATTTQAIDDPVAQEAERCGVAVFRGDAQDVLDRYLGAARMLDASAIMRITCDCPLIDPAVCDEVLRLRALETADYASNVATAGWPHGLDCEAFTRDVLERAAREASTDDDREHVTLWMRRNKLLRHAALDGPGGAIARQRWTLDYPEDLEFLEALFCKLPPAPATPGWRDIATVLCKHPEITDINRNRIAERSERARFSTELNAIAKDGKPVTLRLVQISDSALMLEWQQDPQTRRFSRNPETPDSEAHHKWVTERLRDPDSLLNMILHDGVAAGVIQLNRKPPNDDVAERWEISIYVAPGCQNLGLARAALSLAQRLVSDCEFIAEVLPGNTASHALFRSAGYTWRDGLYHLTVPSEKTNRH